MQCLLFIRVPQPQSDCQANVAFVCKNCKSYMFIFKSLNEMSMCMCMTLIRFMLFGNIVSLRQTASVYCIIRFYVLYPCHNMGLLCCETCILLQ